MSRPLPVTFRRRRGYNRWKMNDSELLREFVDTGSDGVFAQIVERHVHAVYSMARRVFQNNHLAA